MTTRHFKFFGSGNYTETHAYTQEEVYEVFGPNGPALDEQGFFFTDRGGLWVDMDYAASVFARKTRARQAIIARAEKEKRD
jgi:hypothetical protein